MKKKMTFYCFLVILVCYGLLNTAFEESSTARLFVNGILYASIVLFVAFFIKWFDERYQNGGN